MDPPIVGKSVPLLIHWFINQHFWNAYYLSITLLFVIFCFLDFMIEWMYHSQKQFDRKLVKCSPTASSLFPLPGWLFFILTTFLTEFWLVGWYARKKLHFCFRFFNAFQQTLNITITVFLIEGVNKMFVFSLYGAIFSSPS